MKENWPRQAPAVELDAVGVGQLVLPLFPGDSLRSFTQVGGGLTNTNYKVRLAQHRTPLLLRLYQRGVAPARKEMAIDALIAPRVPVLRFFHLGEANPVTGHPYAVLDWIEGPDLQQSLAHMPQARLLALAPKIGGTLAAIHGFGFDKFGFFEDDLKVRGPIDFDRAGLIAYLDQSLLQGPGGERLGPELTQGLLAYAAKHGDILSDWLQQPSLVHGDFNASNILMRPEAGDEIAAIIDWEYALSASPAIDFGNLLRPPFDANTAFAETVARAYVEAGGFLPRDWRRIARLADIFSFADILSRPHTDVVVVADARRIVAGLLENPAR
ncbi:MAG: aminoglycoside phosphotransferase family protein [Methylovirgula sp.]|nr:aminoglycoside phosphotransferase family protein [Methylovirgula sp.]